MYSTFVSVGEMVESGNDVVISGIGGKFPEANNIFQLQGKLFSKQDLVTDEIRHIAGKVFSVGASVFS